MSLHRNKIGIFIFFLVLGFIVYAPTLCNKFVLDDYHTIVNNGFVRSLKYIPDYFKGKFSPVPTLYKMYRPLLMSSFNLNYFLHKYWLPGYHIFNISLHILNAYLLYLILTLIFPLASVSLLIFISLIFLVHPLNVETVSYISCRSDLLVTLFILLSFYNLLLRETRNSIRYLFFSYFCFLLALLTKEVALLALLFFFIYFWKNSRKGNSLIRWRYFLPYLLLGMIYIWMLFPLYHSSLYPPQIRSWWSNTLTQSKVAFLYIKLFLLPYHLSLDHIGILSRGNNDFPGLVAFSFIILFLSAIILKKRKMDTFTLGVVWYFSFLISKFLVKLNFVALEHHFYLPGIGLYFCLASLGERFVSRIKKYLKYFAGGLISIMVLVSFLRTFEWRNSFFLFQSVLKRNPSSTMALTQLASYYRRAGFYNRALVMYKKVLHLPLKDDEKEKIMVYIAETYRLKKNLKEARKWAEAAGKIDRGFYLFYHERGLLALDEGKLSQAQQWFKKELQVVPDYYQAFYNLGLLAFREGRFQEAEKFFRKAVASNPGFGEAYFYLALIYEHRRDIKSAISFYEKCLAFLPHNFQAHYNLGTIFAREGDARAIKELKAALEIEPDYPQAYYNLGLFYLSLGDTSKAISYLKLAEELGYPLEEVKEKFNLKW